MTERNAQGRFTAKATETKLVTVATSATTVPDEVAAADALVEATETAGVVVRSRPYWRDLAERAGATFIETLLASTAVGAVVVTGTSVVFDAHSVLAGLAISGSATVLAVLKALLARMVGDTASASLDPTV